MARERGKDPTANVTVTFTSAGGGTVYAEFAKQYAGGGGDWSNE
jgi:hypothetical protein